MSEIELPHFSSTKNIGWVENDVPAAWYTVSMVAFVAERMRKRNLKTYNDVNIGSYTWFGASRRIEYEQ